MIQPLTGGHLAAVMLFLNRLFTAHAHQRLNFFFKYFNFSLGCRRIEIITHKDSPLYAGF